MELLIAVTLISMILVCIVAVDIASRKFFSMSDYESRVQNEVSPVLEMIAKQVSKGYGNNMGPGVYVPSNNRLEIRRFNNTTATYEDLTDDDWIAYAFNNSAKSIIAQGVGNCTAIDATPPYRCLSWRSGPGFEEVIAKNISSCNFTVANNIALNNNLWITINVTAMRDATQPMNATNPSINLNTTVALRSQSIR